MSHGVSTLGAQICSFSSPDLCVGSTIKHRYRTLLVCLSMSLPYHRSRNEMWFNSAIHDRTTAMSHSAKKKARTSKASDPKLRSIVAPTFRLRSSHWTKQINLLVASSHLGKAETSGDWDVQAVRRTTMSYSICMSKIQIWHPSKVPFKSIQCIYSLQGVTIVTFLLRSYLFSISMWKCSPNSHKPKRHL